VNKGNVSVIVPKSLPFENIESLLVKKNRWIKEKMAIQQDVIATKPREFISGESFSYLGRNYRLKIEQGLYPSIKLQQGQFVVSVCDKEVDNISAIKQLLVHWYKNHAETKLAKQTHRYAIIIGVNPKSITSKSFKSRWGSCSQGGDIQYNWKIIMAPCRIVDYVVIHELCHILHHNHSPDFWKLVERYCADYIECKEWLKFNGKWLEFDKIKC
jgi:predicted metal-dependent hydrolase